VLLTSRAGALLPQLVVRSNIKHTRIALGEICFITETSVEICVTCDSCILGFADVLWKSTSLFIVRYLHVVKWMFLKLLLSPSKIFVWSLQLRR